MSAAPPRAPFRGLNALYARTLAVDAGGDELALTYDFAGNILRQELTNDGTDTTALRYTHDAWNRLVKVEFEDEEEDLHPRGEYEYNGLNWRTIARIDSDTTNSTHALDELRTMYYSHEWRLLEVRVDANYQSSPGINSHVQHVWGERYIDDIVSTRHDPDPSAEDGYETVQFHATDAQFSTVAMLSSSAAVLKRVTYSAYGVARHHWLGDVDGDGDADTTDVGLVNAAIGKAIGDVGYRSEFDLNRDGSITLADRGLMSAASALPEGVLSSVAVGNRIGYCGYVFAPETRSYLVRFRWYLPPLGRWGQRDPAGYVDGMNLYEYVRSRPSSTTDPTGLQDPGWVRLQEKRMLDDLRRRIREEDCGSCTGIDLTLVQHLPGDPAMRHDLPRLIAEGKNVRLMRSWQGVLDAIDSEIERCKAKREVACCCIRNLTLNAHGAVGLVLVGDAPWFDSDVPPADGSATELRHRGPSNSNIAIVAALKSRLCRHSTVFFNSCRTGRGEMGREMLREVGRQLVGSDKSVAVVAWDCDVSGQSPAEPGGGLVREIAGSPESLRSRSRSRCCPEVP